MSYTRLVKAAANYGDNLFKRATQQRTLKEGVKEALETKGRAYLPKKEVINGKEEIVTYWKNADGTISRNFAQSQEIYDKDGFIKTGEYLSANGNGKAVFNYSPTSSIDCDYTLTCADGDTFGGLLMNQAVGGRHIEELILGGKKFVQNDGSLGHWFEIFIKDIFGG